MSASPCFLFKNSFIQMKGDEKIISTLPDKVRGIYILYEKEIGNEIRKGEEKEVEYRNAVYIGIARGKRSGAKSRLRSHLKTKKGWTHFSFFEIWDNIPNEQVEELEGMFLNIFNRDRNSLGLNVVKGNTKLNAIDRKGKADWLVTSLA